MHIVLYEPEIPSNTGNIARTCVVTGTTLHLIEPLGFRIDEKSVRRAGLDYWQDVDIHVYKDFDAFLTENKGGNFYFLSTKGKAYYHERSFKEEDYLIFGPETRGLPEEILSAYEDQVLKVPMGKSYRSLNLSNSVAIVLYEGLRQLGFKDML